MKQFAFITDIHLHEEIPVKHGVNAAKNWKIIIADVEKRGIDTIVFGGDIGDSSAHEEFFNALKSFKLNLILGNHDRFEEVILHYDNFENTNADGLYYKKDDENFRCIFLDSSLAEIGEKQVEFLENCLQTEKKIVIFVHHPILEIDAYVDKKYPLKNRDAISKILRSIPNEVYVFSGHYHLNDEQFLGNIRQVVTPAASYQILRNPEKLETTNHTFGYNIISIDRGKITNELIGFRNQNF